MADGKWIRGLTPETPADDAARRILAERLGAVADAIPAVILRPAGDPEAVHQLRVAARRAAAAVRAVRPRLRRKAYLRVSGALRELRQSAGAARDWDVFLGRAAEGVGSRWDRMLLSGYALGQREAATAPLLAAVSKYQPRLLHWAESPGALLSRRARRRRGTAQELAGAFVGPLLAEFDRSVENPPTDAEAYHALRVAGKRVRYALELFRDLTPTGYAADLYPAVEALQELLGRSQDAAAGAARLAPLLGHLALLPPGDAEAARHAVEDYVADLGALGEVAQGEFPAWREQWRALRETADAPAGGA